MAGIGHDLKHDLDNPAYLGLARKLDQEIVATAASTAWFIESFLNDAEILQVSDPDAKEWVETVKDAYYDLIDAFEELNLQEVKIKSRLLGHPLSFFDLRTGLHKARGIIYQIHALVAKNAKDFGFTPERIIRAGATTHEAEGRALAGLVFRLIDGFLYPEHKDLVRKLGRGMLRETLASAFEVLHVIRDAEILEVTDQAMKQKWVKSAERILHNAIDVFEEVKREAKMAGLLAHQLSFCNPHMGRHKIRGIVNQLVVVAVCAEILVLSSRRIRASPPTTSSSNVETIHGQDEEGATAAASVFRLIDDLLNREHENLVQEMDTSILREILHRDVLVIYNAESPHKSDRLAEESVKRAKDILYNLINVFEEVKRETKEAKLSIATHRRRKAIRATLPTTSLTYEATIRGRDGGRRTSIATLPTTSLTNEKTIHGRDRETTTLITKLLNVEEDIQFISIVGMGGIGKSALARLVYNHPLVTSFFDRRAWVFVSEDFSPRDIVKAIIDSLTSNPVNEVEVEALELRFRQIIFRQRCLFVLDDVWSEIPDKWLYLKRLFEPCAAASKILITTRNEKVALSAGSNIIYLHRLSDEACWSIIKDSAFGTRVEDESQVEKIFKEVGKDIAKKCNGLPLIAKSLGGVLRFKETIQQWQEVLQSERQEVLQSERQEVSQSERREVLQSERQEALQNDVRDIEAMTDLRPSLMLSYSMMPPKLRQCLLYCSIFPKNHSIDVGKLIKLWMAQGFVTSDQDEMEREGWGYVQQLLDRSIFQEFEQDGNGNIKCKLEGGMRDLIQFLAENECHVMLLDHENEPKRILAPKMSRHCTLNIASQTSLPKSIAYAKKLHTLMILSEYSSADPTNLASLLRHTRRVRALDLSSCSIKELPLKVVELLYLRYLDLSFNHDLKKLPQAICNLVDLQTLNLNGCHSLRKLPKGMGKLNKLRHLEILWTTSLSYLPKGIASLTSLRTLSRFIGNSVADSIACNLGDLENLNYIQGCITIDGLGGETDVSNAAKASLNNKKDLLGLELWFSAVGSGSNDKGVLEALDAPPQLQGLGIFYYRGESFPNWMTALENLTHLMLSDCSKCSILPPLGKMPSLESLKIKNMSPVKKVGSEFLGIGLNNADGGEEGSSSTIAFPKLQKLCFQKLDDWEEWTGINGNRRHANIMPTLSSLSIINCPKLRKFPDYIEVEKLVSCDIEKCPLLEETQRINDNDKTKWTAQREQVKYFTEGLFIPLDFIALHYLLRAGP